MTQTYDALMSYTRFDDEHDGDFLTDFREHLSREVRAHSGKPFRIFQDVEDIKVGQQFKQRIDAALAEITFFIPILTPSFFTSKWCRYELEQFLQHEARLGRGDLVLPVYYIRVPALDDPARRAHDPLAQTLAARQYIDWRDMRFEPIKTPSVRRALARMAQQIADALDAPPPPARTPPPPARSAADYVAQGDAYREAEEYQQAAEAYTEALRLDPGNAAAYAGRGRAYNGLGEHQRAIADSEQAMKLDPRHALAYFVRGAAYGKLGEHQRAIADFDRAIALDPQDALAYFNRGLAYNNLSEYQRAIADLDRAIALDPQFALAYYNRGIAYHSLGEHQRAIADYEQCLQRSNDPSLCIQAELLLGMLRGR
jgi:tetratricopeptide (TPR) repeat protein